MSAGGTWKVQNKKRPGAYINFVAVPRVSNPIGDRGTVAVCLPMTWGAENELIEVTGEELLSGASVKKIGVDAQSGSESLPFRTALAGCVKGLFYRMDTGATKATATMGDFTVDAKYGGTFGNKIGAALVLKSGSEYTFQVLVNGEQVESFLVSTVAALEAVESEYVDVTAAENATLAANAGVTLAGGTNGSTGSSSLAGFFTALNTAQFETFAVMSSDATLASTVTTKVRTLREEFGKKVQAVVFCETPVDYEGVICVKQGFKGTEEVGTNLFPLYVASITAGAAVNESNTGRVVEGADTIINPINDNEIAAALEAGWFVLSYRQDGAVCVEQDINSLVTYGEDKAYAFSKNRVIRCLDAIGNDAALIFNRSYKGKVTNDANGRNLYKASLVSLFNQLSNLSAIKNFDGSSDITVLPGQDIDSVVVDVVVEPVDSMEKLYMTVNVNA